MSGTVLFDDAWPAAIGAIAAAAPGLRSAGLAELWVIRDLTGRLRLVIGEPAEGMASLAPPLSALATGLHDVAGAHAYDPESAVLRVEPESLDPLRKGAVRQDIDGLPVYLADRLVSGGDWAVTRPVPAESADHPVRFALFATKGGVGRSTTAAVMAAHLAARGRRVMVVDVDLESPGVTGLLLRVEEQPDFGVVDWFVEDMVGQGNAVDGRLVGRPGWSQDLRGEILVVPAYGRLTREYIPKLGRVFLSRPPASAGEAAEPWPRRLLRLLRLLEKRERPDVVLLDARSGLHDLAAAAVTVTGAEVLLFGTNAAAVWEGYRFLFEHWRQHQAAQAIRDRLTVVAALVPDIGTDAYLKALRERAWDLFRDSLYDEVAPGTAADEPFSFDLMDPSGPHYPLPIHWIHGLAAASSLRDLDGSVLDRAYGPFLARIDQMVRGAQDEGD